MQVPLISRQACMVFHRHKYTFLICCMQIKFISNREIYFSTMQSLFFNQCWKKDNSLVCI